MITNYERFKKDELTDDFILKIQDYLDNQESYEIMISKCFPNVDLNTEITKDIIENCVMDRIKVLNESLEIEMIAYNWYFKNNIIYAELLIQNTNYSTYDLI